MSQVESPDRLLYEVCEVMRYLYISGLISSLSGNVSIKLDGNRIAITPSGKIKFLLRPEDISIVSINGQHLGGPKPSIEVEMHISAYSSCLDCRSVVHVHGLFSPVLAGVLDPVIDLELKAFGVRICYVTELPPGSKELAKSVSKAISSGCNAVVLKNHGIVGVGRSLGEAVEVVEAVEKSFKRSLILRVLNTSGSTYHQNASDKPS